MPSFIIINITCHKFLALWTYYSATLRQFTSIYSWVHHLVLCACVFVYFGMRGTLQKRIGCFNLWMVTLVADKLRRLWLWEVYVGIANCISNLSPNRTLQQPEHLWGSHYNYTSKMLIKAGDSHRCSVVTISARSWLLLHAFWYKPVWCLPQWLLTARSWL